MKELITYLASSLVDEPEHVRVEEVCDGDHTTLRLHVRKEDLGKVIGKKGRTAKAMRALLAVATTGQKSRTSLEIIEPDEAVQAS